MHVVEYCLVLTPNTSRTVGDMVCDDIDIQVYPQPGDAADRLPLPEPQHVATFALSPTATATSPQLWSFILSASPTARLYGVSMACGPRHALALVSRWPFLHAMSTWLQGLYALRRSPAGTMEAHVCNIVHEVPAPPRGRLQVQWFVGDHAVTASRPAAAGHPAVVDTQSLLRLFQLLSVDAVLTAVRCLLTEQRVLVHAPHPQVLAPVMEALASLLFPLVWAGTYVPFLPPTCDLSVILDAPCPFFIGTTTASVGNLQPVAAASGVVVVNLGSGVVALPPPPAVVPAWPPDVRSALTARLTRCTAGVHTPRAARLRGCGYMPARRPRGATLDRSGVQQALLSHWFLPALGDYDAYMVEVAPPGGSHAAGPKPSRLSIGSAATSARTPTSGTRRRQPVRVASRRGMAAMTAGGNSGLPRTVAFGGAGVGAASVAGVAGGVGVAMGTDFSDSDSDGDSVDSHVSVCVVDVDGFDVDGTNPPPAGHNTIPLAACLAVDGPTAAPPQPLPPPACTRRWSLASSAAGGGGGGSTPPTSPTASVATTASSAPVAELVFDQDACVGAKPQLAPLLGAMLATQMAEQFVLSRLVEDDVAVLFFDAAADGSGAAAAAAAAAAAPSSPSCMATTVAPPPDVPMHGAPPAAGGFHLDAARMAAYQPRGMRPLADEDAALAEVQRARDSAKDTLRARFIMDASTRPLAPVLPGGATATAASQTWLSRLLSTAGGTGDAARVGRACGPSAALPAPSGAAASPPSGAGAGAGSDAVCSARAAHLRRLRQRQATPRDKPAASSTGATATAAPSPQAVARSPAACTAATAAEAAAPVPGLHALLKAVGRSRGGALMKALVQVMEVCGDARQPAPVLSVFGGMDAAALAPSSSSSSPTAAADLQAARQWRVTSHAIRALMRCGCVASAVLVLAQATWQREGGRALRQRLQAQWTEVDVSVTDRWLGVGLAPMGAAQLPHVVEWVTHASATRFLATPPVAAAPRVVRGPTVVAFSDTYGPSPAAAAGAQLGDVVLAVGGTVAYHLPSGEVTALLRSAARPVTLTLLRRRQPAVAQLAVCTDLPPPALLMGDSAHTAPPPAPTAAAARRPRHKRAGGGGDRPPVAPTPRRCVDTAPPTPSSSGNLSALFTVGLQPFQAATPQLRRTGSARSVTGSCAMSPAAVGVMPPPAALAPLHRRPCESPPRLGGGGAGGGDGAQRQPRHRRSTSGCADVLQLSGVAVPPPIDTALPRGLSFTSTTPGASLQSPCSTPLLRHGVEIDTRVGSACPDCGQMHSASEVVVSLRRKHASAHDYTTGCLRCGKAFVPRFQVRAAVGAGGWAAPSLWCEFLSLPNLHKEVENVAASQGGNGATLSCLRAMHPTLYYNVVVSVLVAGLDCPMDFLLLAPPGASAGASPPVQAPPSVASSVSAALTPRRTQGVVSPTASPTASPSATKPVADGGQVRAATGGQENRVPSPVGGRAGRTPTMLSRLSRKLKAWVR